MNIYKTLLTITIQVYEYNKYKKKNAKMKYSKITVRNLLFI